MPKAKSQSGTPAIRGLVFYPINVQRSDATGRKWIERVIRPMRIDDEAEAISYAHDFTLDQRRIGDGRKDLVRFRSQYAHLPGAFGKILRSIERLPDEEDLILAQTAHDLRKELRRRRACRRAG